MDKMKTHDDNKDDFSMKVDKHVKNIAKKKGYITYDVEKKELSLNGASYMGTLHEIKVRGRTADGDKETNIFMKHIVNSDVALIYNAAEVYKREHFVYKELIKELYNLQEEGNVPPGDRFVAAKPFDECNDETIILENLAVNGFKTYYRMDVVNLEYAELVVKHLARLHGLSLAMKVLRPDYFEKKIKDMNCLYFFDSNWYGFVKNICSVALPFLEAHVRKRVEKPITRLLDKYCSYMTDASCIKTICHGDFRHSNIMVKEVNGKPTDVIAVDYQITHLGNPVLDFLYFIFWGTDQEFRKNHLEHLKNLYHQHLGTFLNYFNIDVEDVFPLEEFEKQYEEKLDFGLMIAVFYLPFLFPPEDDMISLSDNKDPLDKLVIKVDEKYGERFRGIVDDFIQWGYL